MKQLFGDHSCDGPQDHNGIGSSGLPVAVLQMLLCITQRCLILLAIHGMCCPIPSSVAGFCLMLLGFARTSFMLLNFA